VLSMRIGNRTTSFLDRSSMKVLFTLASTHSLAIDAFVAASRSTGAATARRLVERNTGQRRAVPSEITVYHVGLVGEHRTARDRHSDIIADNH
jgi:hypothetical protein